jgi:hypothetical protein
MSSNQVVTAQPVAPPSVQNTVPSSSSNEPSPQNTQGIVSVMHKEPSPLRTIYAVFHMIVALFALYLSFKCNKGFDLASFLMACCCPYIYIVYKFATSDDFCGIRSSGTSS